jgi:hypothetical protein
MNQKRYWLSWGITFGIIFALAYLAFFFIVEAIPRPVCAPDAFNCPPATRTEMKITETAAYVLFIPLILLSLTQHIIPIYKLPTYVELPIVIAVVFICYFIVGAILGWIYGRIKARRNPQIGL